MNAFHERKLDALEDLIESANGKSILVAYWFKHDLARITERLNKAVRNGDIAFVIRDRCRIYRVWSGDLSRYPEGRGLSWLSL